MAQQQKTFSPAVASSHHLSHCSFNPHHTTFGTESGYASGFSLSSRPFGDNLEVTVNQSLRNNAPLLVPTPSGGGESQTTPRTTAAINYISSLQLSTPRLGLRSSSNRKGTPLKRQQSQCLAHHSSVIYETTPKKAKSHENIENDLSLIAVGRSKMPFQARLDISSPRHALSDHHSDKLDCTFDAISSSTPIGKPFRADLYEQHLEEIPLRNLTRSGGKNTRTKIIRKMQSFSPRKLMGMRAGKIPLQEMDQNSVDFKLFAPSAGLCPVEEEESPIPKINAGAAKKSLFGASEPGGGFANGLRNLIFGDIKMDAEIPVNISSDRPAVVAAAKESSHHQETSSQLLDLYVTNLSNLDGCDSNSKPATEDGDVSMNNSLVIQYFDELKRNTTQVQEQPDRGFEELKPKDSWELNRFTGADLAFLDKLAASVKEEKSSAEKQPIEMEVVHEAAEQNKSTTQPSENPPMLLRKRKRPSTEMIHGVLATPKKMKRSQSFHLGDVTGSTIGDENMSVTDLSTSQFLSPLQRLGGARKRLNYEPIARNRYSPAKRHLTFDGKARRRSLVGVTKLNIFRHLANCPPVRDYFFEFVEDRDLATIYSVNRQCKAIIEEHPKLNARRQRYLETAVRKKENTNASTTSSSSASSDDSTEQQRIHGSICEKSSRIPLNNRNVDTSRQSSLNESHLSPLVSPSKRKFHENQKAVQQHPGAVFMHCPRCRSSSIIEDATSVDSSASERTIDSFNETDNGRSFKSTRSLRSFSLCVSDLEVRRSSVKVPVRKQQSLPENGRGVKLPIESGRMAVCQSIQCGFKFCVHCRYAFGVDHKCVEIGTLSPLIKQSQQPRVVACTKQSRRNLKRL